MLGVSGLPHHFIEVKMANLVLRRKVGESILIGDDIEITVVEVGRVGVQLCINAPRNVPVDRKEIREAKNRAKK